VRPQDVVSPRDRWHLIELIWDGRARGANWSMALGRWRNRDDETWRPVLAQRWDGPGNSLGMPISTGHAVWFVVPDETYPILVDSEFVPAEKRVLVKAILGLDQNGRTAA
jgi:hypothetical protein